MLCAPKVSIFDFNAVWNCYSSNNFIHCDMTELKHRSVIILLSKQSTPVCNLIQLKKNVIYIHQKPSDKEEFKAKHMFLFYLFG